MNDLVVGEKFRAMHCWGKWHPLSYEVIRIDEERYGHIYVAVKREDGVCFEWSKDDLLHCMALEENNVRSKR